jgi:hypothetical protein
MKRSIVVTEGPSDVILLRSISGIAADDPHIEFRAAGSWSSADSLARSALVRGRGDVALVVDADANDAERVKERKRFLDESLHSIASPFQSRAFVIVPEIEGLLFQDRTVVEALIGHKITDLEFIHGQYEPKKVLEALLQGKSRLQVFQSQLQQIDLSPLRELPVIKELQDFLHGVTQVSLAS